MLKVETKGFRKMNEASSPAAADFIFQNHKNEQWRSRWGIDKNNYFAITFSWQIFGGGKKCGNRVMTIKTVGALCTCVWVQMSMREKQCNWARRFCQPGKQMSSYFLRLYDPRLSHSRKQSEHLCYALIISEIVTIRYFIYDKVLWKCFFIIRDLFLLLLQNTVPISCRRNSPITQLHVKGTSHLIQWSWVFGGHCNWWF